jgi:predicted nucleic acid-binding protein
VLIDTSVWIYHFEQHPELGAAASKIIESLEEGEYRGVASELTLLELTVRPLQLGRQDVADDYEVLLDYFPNFELEPISREISAGSRRTTCASTATNAPCNSVGHRAEKWRYLGGHKQ